MKKSVVALLLIGSLAAGCGEEGEPAAEPAAPPLTKAQLIKRGDAICRAGAARATKAANRQLDASSTRADVRRFVVRTAIPELERQHDELRALAPPRTDAPRIDAMLDALQEGIEKTRKDPLAMITDGTVFAEANRIARKYGFKACSE